MHHRRLHGVLAALLLFTLSAPALGAGLELREQGAVAISMADAVTARCQDASTVYYNPAGMGFLDGLSLTLGVTLAIPTWTWQDPDGNFPDQTNTNAVEAVPHVYAAWAINDMFAVGLSFNVPMGLRIEWPESWPGAHIGTESAMAMYLINPSFSVRPLDNLSVAVGLQLIPATVEITRRLGFVTEGGLIAPGDISLGGAGFGVGGNFGIMYRPTDWLYLGFTYRSRVAIAFEGDAHFELPDSVTDRSVFHDQAIRADVTLPDMMVFGIGFAFAERFYLEFDLDVSLWSSISNLTIRFPDDASGELTQPQPRDWKDVLTPRLGFEWQALDEPRHGLWLRLGGGYDMVASPAHTLDPLLPDSEHVYVTAGLGYRYVPWRIQVDVGYMLSMLLPRTVDENSCAGESCNAFAQRYDGSHIHLLAIDLSASFF